jgi:signal transduction histidine kinase
MDHSTATFESYAAERLERSAADIAAEWIGHLPQSDGGGAADLQVSVQAAAELIRRTADFLLTDDADALRRSPLVREAAGALVRERAARGRSRAALLAELDVLAQMLDGVCIEWLGSYPGGTPPPESVVRVAGRLNRAPILMGEIGMKAVDGGGNAGDGGAPSEVQRFADMLSHELNTPLNAAGVTAQLLEYTNEIVTSDEARRLVTLIRRNLARADAIMRDVRTVALSHGQQQAGAVRSFGQVLGSVLTEVHDELVREGVRLDIEEPVADVRVDAARVKLILVNLVRNAIRYSDPKRSDRHVMVSCSRKAADGQWWVYVSDNGLGIPAEYHDSIFHRHFRAHPERGTGTGLGLMIVRAEVAKLGAEISFSSEPGRGTRFGFSLPEADRA